MKRYSLAAAVMLAALLLQACSSFNPFGGGSDRPHMGPPGSADGGPGGPNRPKRIPEAMALKRFAATGDLTKAALEDALKADFKKDDTNGDGYLDTIETRTVNEQLRLEPNMSPVFDWNADGRIDYSEFATQWRTLFDRADRNRDGIVSADEISGRGSDHAPRDLPKPSFSGRDGRPPGSP